jgi:hypothetical protein
MVSFNGRWLDQSRQASQGRGVRGSALNFDRVLVLL